MCCIHHTGTVIILWIWAHTLLLMVMVVVRVASVMSHKLKSVSALRGSVCISVQCIDISAHIGHWMAAHGVRALACWGCQHVGNDAALAWVVLLQCGLELCQTSLVQNQFSSALMPGGPVWVQHFLWGAEPVQNQTKLVPEALTNLRWIHRTA